MKEYEYNGYIIKQVRDQNGLGLTWAVYKNDELFGYADREKIAKEIVDWDIQYNQ